MTILHDMDPVLFGFGPVQLHWYGVMYLLGFATALWLGTKRIKEGRLPGVDTNQFGDLLFYGILGVILGGRIGYILFYAFDDFIQDPIMFLKINQGGMSFHGGLLGVLVAAWIWSRRRKIHFMDTVDFVAPLVPPGLGFGRVGNYINGELWGKFTQSDWGVVFPYAPELQKVPMDEVRSQFATGALNHFARHPSQLYQAALEGLVMFVILWMYSRKPRPRFAVAGLFALLYGIFRFIVEFVRVPDAQLGYLAFGWLTMGQVLSVPLILLGLGMMMYSRTEPTLQPAP